jgi:predicted DNA-binding transcriptional regulator YafY
MDPWSREAREPAPQKQRAKKPKPSRGERLVAIVRALQGDSDHTGAAIAQALGIKPRTLYRDMIALRASGVPVEGQPGVGYALRTAYMTPGVEFTLDEVEALATGARLVSAWGTGSVIARAAADAIEKIESVLPRGLKTKAKPAVALEEKPDPAIAPLHDLLTRSIRGRWRVMFDYEARSGPIEAKVVKPLSLVYWRAAWQLCAWDETIQQFQGFYLDGMRNTWQGAPFAVVHGERLEDFLRQIRVEKLWG